MFSLTPRISKACASLLILMLFICSLTACLFEKKIDASSQEKFQKSITAIKENLSETDKEKFEEALKFLSMRSIIGEKPDSPLEMLGRLAALKDSTPEMLFQKVAKDLDGKSAKEVIAYADNIKKDRVEAQKSKLNGQIADLEKSLQDVEKDKAATDNLTSKILISNSRFYFSRNSYIRTPVIAFTIENKTPVALRRVYFHGILESAGRTIPWVDDDFNYEFKGGLEPNEKQSLNLEPNMFSDWGNSDLAGKKDLIMTITVRNFEGADGNKVLDQDVQTPEEIKSKIEQVKKSLSELE